MGSLSAREYAKVLKLWVDAQLELALPMDGKLPQKDVVEAMRWSLLSGGKRVRGSLMLMSGKLFELRREELLPYVTAVEMIHAYSLIHDDLPCMDDATLRRGQECCHIRYGEGMAVLAGDALLNSAMETLIEAALEGRREAEASLILARAAGVSGMIGGQTVDLLWAGNGPEDLDSLLFLDEKKTGALLEACFTVPAALAGAPRAVRGALSVIGRSTGLIFQIRDDLLDVTADPETLGKMPGKDARDEKLSAVRLLGADGCEELMTQLSCEAEAAFLALKAAGYETRLLEDYLAMLETREK